MAKYVWIFVLVGAVLVTFLTTKRVVEFTEQQKTEAIVESFININAENARLLAQKEVIVYEMDSLRRENKNLQKEKKRLFGELQLEKLQGITFERAYRANEERNKMIEEMIKNIGKSSQHKPSDITRELLRLRVQPSQPNKNQ